MLVTQFSIKYLYLYPNSSKNYDDASEGCLADEDNMVKV